jgi:hypothetical protein
MVVSWAGLARYYLPPPPVFGVLSQISKVVMTPSCGAKRRREMDTGNSYGQSHRPLPWGVMQQYCPPSIPQQAQQHNTGGAPPESAAAFLPAPPIRRWPLLGRLIHTPPHRRRQRTANLIPPYSPSRRTVLARRHISPPRRSRCRTLPLCPRAPLCPRPAALGPASTTSMQHRTRRCGSHSPAPAPARAAPGALNQFRGAPACRHPQRTSLSAEPPALRPAATACGRLAAVGPPVSRLRSGLCCHLTSYVQTAPPPQSL